MEKFAPLHATRSLGVLKADKLKELGLDAPKKKLELTARGVKHTFAIGSSPYGVSDPYVKDEQDGRVYVLGGGVINDLDSAGTRLVDRQLHAFKPGDFDTVTISAGGKSRTLQAPQAENQFAAKLINSKTGKPDDLAKNWHDKIWRMMVTDVLGKGEAPTTGTPEVACKIKYKWHGKPKGFVELGRIAPPPVASNVSAPPTAQVESWARIGADGELGQAAGERGRRDQRVQQGRRRRVAAALLPKYERMRELRAARAGDEARAALRELAREWPGALKELDTLATAEIERRATACAAGEAEAWMAWSLRYHELMRAALAIRRGEAPDGVNDLFVRG